MVLYQPASGVLLLFFGLKPSFTWLLNCGGRRTGGLKPARLAVNKAPGAGCNWLSFCPFCFSHQQTCTGAASELKTNSASGGKDGGEVACD